MWQRPLSVIRDVERHRSGAGRIRVVSGITLAAYIIVVAQLWHLQVLEGPHLSELSDRNRIRIRPLPAPRGTLYDRHGVALVEARPSFVLSIVPRELEDQAWTIHA
jgi:penicillin-binding protein 2